MNSSIAPTSPSNIRHCAHCGLPYDWRRSTSSSLKMTYCGALCEKGDLGFTIDTLLQAQRFAPARSTSPVEIPTAGEYDELHLLAA